MVTLRNFISASLGLFLLTRCNTKQDSNSTPPIPSLQSKSLTANPLIGEWKFSNSIWYPSELTLQDNGTFIFHDQGCYGQRFSQGQWTNNNGEIMLTSFDTFRQTEQTASPVFRGSDDSVKIHFDKIVLHLRSDTLYFAGSDKLPTGAKFYRTKKKRIID